MNHPVQLTENRKKRKATHDKSIRSTKDKVLYVVAKVIRVVTIPPVMVGTLIILLSTLRTDIFAGFGQSFATLIFLAIIPVLAYPLSYILPSVRKKGREGQRNLAFVLSILGYTSGVAYGLIAQVNEAMMIIFGTYLMSVLVLTFMNKAIKVRASGHACSIAGPIGLVCYFLPPICIVASLTLYGVIFWASVHMGHHTVKEFIWGSVSSPLSLTIVAILSMLL